MPGTIVEKTRRILAHLEGKAPPAATALLDEASRISALIEPDEELIDLVDVTPVNRTRNFHNFSLETTEFFDDLFLRLGNEHTPNSRSIYRFQTNDGANYRVLTPLARWNDQTCIR